MTQAAPKKAHVDPTADNPRDTVVKDERPWPDYHVRNLPASVPAENSATMRTKCTVTAVTVHPHGAARVHLQPEYDEALHTQLSQKEGHNSGLTLEVSNPSAVEFFTVGQVVYLDLTPIA
jgi:hypothetical protein